jgi:hypothetical protein
MVGNPHHINKAVQLWFHPLAVCVMPDEFRELFGRVFAENAKSTALKPLGWLVTILSASSISAFYFKSPSWLGATFGALTAVSIVGYLVAYAYFAYTDKDALRSEKFYLQKLAIQRGFIGDDMTGYIRLDASAPRALPPPERDEEKAEEDEA